MDDIPIPTPAASQVLVRVTLSGICGTDLLVVSARYQTPQIPLVLGHEFVGEVAAVGSGVEDLVLGERVVAEASWPCRTCSSCLRGMACTNRVSMGRNFDGCFSEYAVVPAAVLHRVADSISDRSAQAFVTVATTAKAVALAQRAREGVTTIVGNGHAGLLMVQLLANTGGPAPTVVGTRSSRLRMAYEAGAGETLNINDPHDRESLDLRIDQGGISPVSIDATGTGEGFGIALGVTTSKGLVIVYSIHKNTDKVSHLDKIYYRELEVVGSRGGEGYHERAMIALETRGVDPAALTSAPRQLSAAPGLLLHGGLKSVTEPRVLLLGE